MVLALGVVLPFPAPGGLSHRGKQKAVRDQKPHTAYIQTQSPLVNQRLFRYNGGWRSIILLCGRVRSRIGARGAGNTLRPAFICLGIPILHHLITSCKRFFRVPGRRAADGPGAAETGLLCRQVENRGIHGQKNVDKIYVNHKRLGNFPGRLARGCGNLCGSCGSPGRQGFPGKQVGRGKKKRGGFCPF